MRLNRKNSFFFLMLVILLASCAQSAPDASQPGVAYRQETVALPTGAPTPKPTPVSTRVLPAEALTPDPTPTITPIPDEVRALVVDVLDGDTITVVMEGDPPGLNYEVRYLGVDAPPNTASVPWGVVAFEVNRKLTKGKIVRLERDQSEVDEEGRLLRYVYLGDELLNISLVEQGLARANITESDTRFQTEIVEAEQQAESANLGLWGSLPTPTPRIIQTGVSTTTTAITTTDALTVTTQPATPSTVEPEATTEETPTGVPSPTPTEARTTATSRAETEEEAQDNSETPEATVEPTPTSDS